MTMPTRLTKREQLAYDWLIANPGPHRPFELAAGAVVGKHTANNLLQQLYVKGRVKRHNPEVGAVHFRYEAVVS